MNLVLLPVKNNSNEFLNNKKVNHLTLATSNSSSSSNTSAHQEQQPTETSSMIKNINLVKSSSFAISSSSMPVLNSNSGNSSSSEFIKITTNNMEETAALLRLSSDLSSSSFKKQVSDLNNNSDNTADLMMLSKSKPNQISNNNNENLISMVTVADRDQDTKHQQQLQIHHHLNNNKFLTNTKNKKHHTQMMPPPPSLLREKEVLKKSSSSPIAVDPFLSFSTYTNKNLTEKQIRDQFYSQYTLGREIGKGGFGIIFSGQRKRDNQLVAIKVIKKSKISQWYSFNHHHTHNNHNHSTTTSTIVAVNKPQPLPAPASSVNNDDVIVTNRIPLEIALMIRVTSVESCVKILDYLEQKNCFIIIMERDEMCQDLFDYITEKGGGLSESMARDFFRQIVETIIKIHELGVIHRDIKDENILVNLRTGQLKIIDFGAGAFFNDPSKLFTDFHGTRVYSPPEWIKHQRYYGDRAAVWSLGVLLFNMIYGDIPWEEDSDIVNCRLYSKTSIVNNATTTPPFISHHHHLTSSSPDDLINKCLIVNDESRITLNDILQHEWLNLNNN